MIHFYKLNTTSIGRGIKIKSIYYDLQRYFYINYMLLK
jgi:hypothetical protein